MNRHSNGDGNEDCSGGKEAVKDSDVPLHGMKEGNSENSANDSLQNQTQQQTVEESPWDNDDDYADSIPMPIRSVEPESSDRCEKVEGTNGSGENEMDYDGDHSSSSTKGVTNGMGVVDGYSVASAAAAAVRSLNIHPNEEPPIASTMDNTMVAVLASSVTNADPLDSAVNSASSAIADLTEARGKEDEEMGVIETIVRNFLGRSEDDSSSQDRKGGDSSSAAAQETEESEESRKWSEWMTSGRKERRTDIVLNDLSSSFEGDDYFANGGQIGSGPGNASSSSFEETALSFPGGMLVQKLIDAGEQQQLQQQQQKKKKPKTKKEIEKEEKRLLKQQMQLEKKEQKQREQKILREQREREPGRVAANDWSHNIFNIPNSTILRDIRYPIVSVFLWATVWSFLHRFMLTIASKNIAGGKAWLSNGAAMFAKHMCVPTVPHSMMVSAMSFLLVFRTNSAYQRFAEGRKIWEDIVDVSRDLSRMVKLYEFAIGTSKCRRINKLLASFPYLLRHRIRPSLMQLRRIDDPSVVRDPENSLLLYPDVSIRDTDPDVAALAYDEEETGSSRRKSRELCWVDKRTLPWKLLPGKALELCARAQNRPLWVCDRMAKELAVVDDISPKFTNRERMTLIGYVDKLSRSIGACERIHQTVVPLNYARHALRSLTVWLWTLPFALVKDLGLLTGPVVAIVSWILYGVYEIGTRIEDPFQGTLRLSIYCDAIRRDVLADAIVRDTAFELEDDGKPLGGEDDDDGGIFEVESESEEYEGDEMPSDKKKKKQTKKGGIAWTF